LSLSGSDSCVLLFQEQKKLINLEYTTKTRFRPRFLSSSRLGKTYISHIFPTITDDNYLIISNQRELHSVGLPTVPTPSFGHTQLSVFDSSVTSGCDRFGDACIVLGFESGTIRRFATCAEGIVPVFELATPSSVTAVQYLKENVILAGSIDGSVILIDFRDRELPRSVAIVDDKFDTISRIPVWPHNDIVAGIGYSAGIVSALDLRMGMPIWSGRTTRVSRLVPLAVDSPGLSFLAMNPDCVEIVVQQHRRPKTTIVYQDYRPYREVLSYRGGALVIDDDGVSFIHGNAGLPLLRLYDLSTDSLTADVARSRIREASGTWDEQQDRSSVHRHQASITCGTIVDDVVVTCDSLGFIHEWRFGYSS
jgi:hypothetical protein